MWNCFANYKLRSVTFHELIKSFPNLVLEGMKEKLAPFATTDDRMT